MSQAMLRPLPWCLTDGAGIRPGLRVHRGRRALLDSPMRGRFERRNAGLALSVAEEVWVTPENLGNLVKAVSALFEQGETVRNSQIGANRLVAKKFNE